MLRKFALTAAVAALSLPAMATAQVPGGNFVAMWDADGDGKVTLAEVVARRTDMLEAFDANDDGALDAAELADMEATGEDMRASMQEDRPGHGTMGDPGLGKSQGMGKGGSNGHGKGMGSGGGQGQPLQAQPHDHAAMDLDGDGRVTLAEFTTEAEEWFATRDRDGDGAITQDDFGPGR